eukprot:116865_1
MKCKQTKKKKDSPLQEHKVDDFDEICATFDPDILNKIRQKRAAENNSFLLRYKNMTTSGFSHEEESDIVKKNNDVAPSENCIILWKCIASQHALHRNRNISRRSKQDFAQLEGDSYSYQHVREHKAKITSFSAKIASNNSMSKSLEKSSYRDQSQPGTYREFLQSTQNENRLNEEHSIIEHRHENNEQKNQPSLTAHQELLDRFKARELYAIFVKVGFRIFLNAIIDFLFLSKKNGLKIDGWIDETCNDKKEESWPFQQIPTDWHQQFTAFCNNCKYLKNMDVDEWKKKIMRFNNGETTLDQRYFYGGNDCNLLGFLLFIKDVMKHFKDKFDIPETENIGHYEIMLLLLKYFPGLFRLVVKVMESLDILVQNLIKIVFKPVLKRSGGRRTRGKDLKKIYGKIEESIKSTVRKKGHILVEVSSLGTQVMVIMILKGENNYKHQNSIFENIKREFSKVDTRINGTDKPEFTTFLSDKLIDIIKRVPTKLGEVYNLMKECSKEYMGYNLFIEGLKSLQSRDLKPFAGQNANFKDQECPLSYDKTSITYAFYLFDNIVLSDLSDAELSQYYLYWDEIETNELGNIMLGIDDCDYENPNEQMTTAEYLDLERSWYVEELTECVMSYLPISSRYRPSYNSGIYGSYIYDPDGNDKRIVSRTYFVDLWGLDRWDKYQTTVFNIFDAYWSRNT